MVDVGVLGAGDAVALLRACGPRSRRPRTCRCRRPRRAARPRRGRRGARPRSTSRRRRCRRLGRGARAARRAAKAGSPAIDPRSPARPGPRCRRSWSSDREARSRDPARGAGRGGRASPGGTTVSLLRRTTTSPLRCRDALVVGRGEAPVLGVEDRPDARVALRGLAQILRRAVARGVVDDEDLEARPRLARERLEASLRELEAAVRHDDDGDQGLRGREPVLDRLVAVRPVVLLGDLPPRGPARVVLRLGERAFELGEELLVVAAAGEIREVRVRQKLRQRGRDDGLSAVEVLVELDRDWWPR